MMDHDPWKAIESRLSAVAHEHWDLDEKFNEPTSVRIRTIDGGVLRMLVTRERQPASAGDIRFIGHLKADLQKLLDHLRGRTELKTEDLDEIETRLLEVSPGPWRAFLTTSGGIGGDSVIWVTELDDEPDLYLWLDGKPAPDKYYELVGSGRQDLPQLLSAIRPKFRDES